MPLTPGTRLGTYEILGALGAGGMGEVYRARDTRLGRDVAVKVLPADVSASPERLERFEREARTVAGLNHPNIVTLFSVEDEDGVRFLTMELVEGQTLVDEMTPGGLPLARLLELAIPLTDALTAAHERGVVHRDLKPGNVMVTRDGRVKVLDFGLAKMARAEDPPAPQQQTIASPATGAGEVLGTVPYMAPEQLRGEQADARSDLFALGIVLYELATGRRPFTGASSAEVSSAILRDTPEPLTRARADLPPDLERIVSRCLEKSPRERIQSALDVNNELRRLRRGLEHGDAKAPAAPAQVVSIAVLPFANRSASADDEYFSDGLADEMINVLAKIRGLRVSARASSFHFKGKDVTPGEIGRTLNVATLLDGSVRKSGNRIRVSVQLVKVADGSNLWSESYDRMLDDIFAVQDDIAQSVVKELRTTLLGEAPGSDASGQAKAEVAHAARGRGTDPEAHRLFLLARHVVQHWTREGFAKGIEYLKQALALDPEFALAWVELAHVHTTQSDFGWASVDDAYRHAREAVERALSLQPDLAEAHVQMAWIRVTSDRDWQGGEASLRRALELAPGNTFALRRAGVLAGQLGRVDEAIAFDRRALEQDPLSPSAWHNLGTDLHWADRLAESEDAYRKAIELAPARLGAHAYLSLALLAQGRNEEALAEATQETEAAYRLWSLSMVHHGLGHAKESDDALRELIANHNTEAAFQIAEAYGHRGDIDAAFDWLDRAYEERDTGLTGLKASPFLRGLHGDPRWETLLRKLGFGE